MRKCISSSPGLSLSLHWNYNLSSWPALPGSSLLHSQCTKFSQTVCLILSTRHQYKWSFCESEKKKKHLLHFALGHQTAAFSEPEDVYLWRWVPVWRVEKRQPLHCRVDRRKQSFLKTMTTIPQLYPIAFHSQWSFNLSSALQSLLHVVSGNEVKKITVVIQFFLFLWGGWSLF